MTSSAITSIVASLLPRFFSQTRCIEKRDKQEDKLIVSTWPCSSFVNYVWGILPLTYDFSFKLFSLTEFFFSFLSLFLSFSISRCVSLINALKSKIKNSGVAFLLCMPYTLLFFLSFRFYHVYSRTDDTKANRAQMALGWARDDYMGRGRAKELNGSPVTIQSSWR